MSVCLYTTYLVSLYTIFIYLMVLFEILEMHFRDHVYIIVITILALLNRAMSNQDFFVTRFLYNIVLN